MRLLGLDPGLRHTGWGGVDVAGNRLSHVAAGVVHSRDGEKLATRLVDLFRQLNGVLDRYARLSGPRTDGSFYGRSGQGFVDLQDLIGLDVFKGLRDAAGPTNLDELRLCLSA